MYLFFGAWHRGKELSKILAPYQSHVHGGREEGSTPNDAEVRHQQATDILNELLGGMVITTLSDMQQLAEADLGVPVLDDSE
jgi:hypothetical protein